LDGYLYTDQPPIGVLLSATLSLSLLFTEPELFLTRGDRIYRIEKRNHTYVYADGVDRGKPATLWLFDRVVTTNPATLQSHHVSFRQVDEQLGADTILVTHLTERAIIAQFSYGDLSVPTLLRIENNRAQFECESVPLGDKPKLEAFRSTALRRRRVVDRLMLAVKEQVEEALPFDEPKTEEGQQDGKLRHEWRMAYSRGSGTFEFNGDTYSVFDELGRAKTPQVCADFITDSWERMSGTRYLRRGEPRIKQIGRLDFDTLDVQNRRSVEKLMDYAAAHSDWFELLLIPESERIPFSNRKSFFARLSALHRDFAPGDVVTILGPRDDNRLHYHSFFVLEKDPITGIATTVAANAGRPRIRTWESEMQNAPRRSIYGRIRPTLEWLESICGLTENRRIELTKRD
jgi:hypothetical protein